MATIPPTLAACLRRALPHVERDNAGDSTLAAESRAALADHDASRDHAVPGLTERMADLLDSFYESTAPSRAGAASLIAHDRAQCKALLAEFRERRHEAIPPSTPSAEAMLEQLTGVLQLVQTAFRELSEEAGDVETWNEGGLAYTASSKVREAVAAVAARRAALGQVPRPEGLRYDLRALADKALGYMELPEYGELSPTDSVRMLPEYATMPRATRGALTRLVREVCSTGSAPDPFLECDCGHRVYREDGQCDWCPRNHGPQGTAEASREGAPAPTVPAPEVAAPPVSDAACFVGRPPEMRVLVVGTAHVTRAEATLFEAGLSPGEWLPTPMRWEFGWMVSIGKVDNADLSGLSDGLRGIIEYAWDLGYEWLRFDCDQLHVKGIPTYEW